MEFAFLGNAIIFQSHVTTFVPQKDWRNVSDRIKESINLAASPIGIALIPSAKGLLDHTNVRLLTRTAPCHMAALARYYRQEGVVGASSEGIKCILGLSCLGLAKTPTRVKEGGLNQRFTSGSEAARNLNRSIRMLGDSGKRYDAVIMSPLDLIPLSPQAIALYVTPAQALRLVLALAYKEGEAIPTSITGQGSLCAAVAKVVDEGSIVLDIPCVGDRAYGFVQEHEMIVAFPAEKSDELIDGLRSTEDAAQHPFKPFLNWPVILWPEFEPRSSDLD